jgi:hypothetical protein
VTIVATETYRFGGSKVPGTASSRLILEGSVRDPKKYVDKGGTVELDEEQATSLRKRGYTLTKASDAEVSETSVEGAPKGTEPKTEEEQLASQASGTTATKSAGTKSAGK